MLDPDDEALRELASLLRRRLEVIADHEFRDRDSEGHLNALKQVSEAILDRHQKMESELPPRLAHFLSSCSFDKALQFIEDTSSRSPSCG